MRTEANTPRQARVAKLAQLDTPVTYRLPLGVVEGTITRKTEASVWATFAAVPERGQAARTIRFTQRLDGDYRAAGTGPHAPTLTFPLALELREQAILAHPANRAANGRFTN